VSEREAPEDTSTSAPMGGASRFKPEKTGRNERTAPLEKKPEPRRREICYLMLVGERLRSRSMKTWGPGRKEEEGQMQRKKKEREGWWGKRHKFPGMPLLLWKEGSLQGEKEHQMKGRESLGEKKLLPSCLTAAACKTSAAQERGQREIGT